MLIKTLKNNHACDTGHKEARRRIHGIHGKTYLGARALCLWEAAMKLLAVTEGTVIARSVPGNNQTPVS